MPLTMHSKARGAHEAAEAANLQGKFWEMHDKIFENPRLLDPKQFVKYAGEIGLNVEKFEKDLKSPAVKKRLDSDMAQAGKLGVTGTPAFFVNGQFISGAQPFEVFQAAIEAALE